MVALGEVFGNLSLGGEVYLLDGPLGSGKTQWVKGLGRGLGVQGVINSPSFTLVRPHAGRLTLHHIDLYRLDSALLCQGLDLDSLVSSEAVLAIEWSERFASFGEGGLRLGFAFGEAEDERLVFAFCQTDDHDKRLGSIVERSRELPGVTL
jgi:tRNA threonylcarbamoyladenosine biosynthesis protein TsaE